MITIKGFPTEVSEYIELPDIAELLVAQPFFDIDAEDAYTKGAPFIRHLLNKTPMRHDKKHVSVLSQVRLMVPNMRSCTSCRSDDPDTEWHIDCELNETGRHIYDRPTDRVHLLSNDVTCLTEFNAHEFQIDFDPDKPYNRFISDLYSREVKRVTAQKMPANRIVTFDNHLHRATQPRAIEFRYMFRVVETDRERPPARMSQDQNVTKAYDAVRQSFFGHITRSPGEILVKLPSVSREMFKYYE